MKKIIMLFMAIGIVIGFSQFVQAEPAIHTSSDAFFIHDADGNAYWVTDRFYKSVQKDGKFINGIARASLPEGAVLPDRPMRGPVGDFGYCGCWRCGDGCEFQITPSGEFKYKANWKAPKE